MGDITRNRAFARPLRLLRVAFALPQYDLPGLGQRSQRSPVEVGNGHNNTIHGMPDDIARLNIYKGETQQSLGLVCLQHNMAICYAGSVARQARSGRAGKSQARWLGRRADLC